MKVVPFQPQEPTSNNHNNVQDETLVCNRGLPFLFAQMKLKDKLAFTYRAITRSKDLQVPNRIVINPLFS